MALASVERPAGRTAAAHPRRTAAVRPARPRILLTTEGTYPYAVGGV